MKRWFLGLCVSLFVVLTVSAARTDTVRVYSETMKKDVKVVVVTPARGVLQAFPVIYLLHGYSGNAASWAQLTDLNRLAELYQVIFACPDGLNSWYWDSPRDPSSQYETFVSRELIAYVDSHFPTVPDRSARAISGLSMGGHGALWSAIRHRDVFGAAGSMSGGVDIRPFPDNWEMKKQLGERDANREVWDAHTVINQVDGLKDGDLALIVDCGADDFFFGVNNALHQALLNRKIAHDYIVRPGGHTGAYWANSIEYHVLFFRKYFNRR
ncbi:MAG: esterase family protein [Prevotellaceae bacterium]|jgi:S-formylglutathione hydrolase FrmB|nr:esterase family protein [Prevotellaceae bacterium]